MISRIGNEGKVRILRKEWKFKSSQWEERKCEIQKNVQLRHNNITVLRYELDTIDTRIKIVRLILAKLTFYFRTFINYFASQNDMGIYRLQLYIFQRLDCRSRYKWNSKQQRLLFVRIDAASIFVHMARRWILAMATFGKRSDRAGREALSDRAIGEITRNRDGTVCPRVASMDRSMRFRYDEYR